jgi:uncharacterized protein (DUF302 family)
MLSCLLVLTFSVVVNAEPQQQDDKKILLTRSTHNFDETLEIVKDVLQKNGFTVAHVQRCDGGLKHMGYNTDKYRIVFFGRKDEVRELSKTHAELIPFLPFKLLIYAEGDQSIISIMNPEDLKGMVKDKDLLEQLTKWKKEFVHILEQTQNS